MASDTVPTKPGTDPRLGNRSRFVVTAAKGRELLAQKLGKALAGNHYSMLRLAAAILAAL
jgi:hypothetical protein